MNGDKPVQPAASQPTPSAAPPSPATPTPTPVAPVVVSPNAAASPAPAAPVSAAAPPPPPSPDADSPWQYRTENAAPAPARQTGLTNAQPLPQAPEGIEAVWSASEFIDHDKNLSWYLILGGVTLVIDVILYFWTHDFVSIVAVTIMAALLGVMASRKPRVLSYRLDDAGLTVGNVFHPYAEFRSFAIIEDGALQSITFLPAKRFLPPISVFYAPEDEARITDVLAQYLPMEMRRQDAIDRLSRRIRF